MATVTTAYVFTDNGVDKAGDDYASGGVFKFFGWSGPFTWTITFPSPIENVTEIDFSVLPTPLENTTSSFSGALRLRAYGPSGTLSTVSSSTVAANGSINTSTLPVISLSEETVTAVEILGPSNSGPNLRMANIVGDVSTFNVTTVSYMDITMYTHIADITWETVVGATNYTLTQIEDAGSEETILSETTELAHTALNLNPGSSYEFKLYTDLDPVNAYTSITDSAPAVDDTSVTSLMTRFSNDLVALEQAGAGSIVDIDSVLRDVLVTGDEVITNLGNVTFVDDSDSLSIGKATTQKILMPFQTTVGASQTATVTGLSTNVVTYNHLTNGVISDSTEYAVGTYYKTGSYKVQVKEL